MASRTLKRSNGEEEIVATQALDLAKPIDAKYLRNVVANGRMRDQRPWKWYREIGEIHYAISRGAKIAGYATITARKLNKDGTPGDIISSGPEAEIAATLSSPYGGPRAFIDRFFTLMKIPGDAYLIKCMEDGEHVGYDFIGASEISRNDTSGGSLGQDTDAVFRPGSKIHRITLPAAGSTNGEELSIEIAAENFLGRIWRPSNQFVDMADSPMRALDVECEQLHLLTLGIKAKLLNRLALNGIFFIPQGMNDIKTGVPDGQSNPAVHENKVMDSLIKAATFAVQNPESAEAAIPIFMSGDLAMGDAIRHIVFDREIYKVDMDLRHELITRLLMGLDVQPQHVKGLGDANHWCSDTETEIMCLTRGWTNQRDLRVGDVVLTLDHATGASAWQPVKDIYRAEVVDEPMLSMESQSHSSLSTKAHRWPIIKTGRKVAGSNRRWTTAEQGFTSTDRVPVAARLIDDSDERKWTDDFVRLVAAYTSDGTILHYYKSAGEYIRICKFDDDEIVQLRRVLTSVYGDHVGWREHAHKTGPIEGVAFALNQGPSQLLRDVTGELKAVKLSFVDQLTSAQLDLFLDSMIEIGDGIRVGNSIQLFQVEPSRLDAFEYAAILAGRKVTRGVRNQQTGFGERPLSWLQISTSRKSFSPVDCIQEWVPYTGIVWCPVTENTTWLARRNGKVFYTGNSAWAVSDDERRINIQPDMETLCWALTRLVLYREMKVLQATNSKITDARISKTCLWYDLTAANVKTNLAEDARQAQDRILISPASARRLTGLSESDAPSDLESIRMIGLKQGDAYLATYGMPEAKKFDWSKIGSHSGGPDPASPADNPTQVGPGVGSPGAPGKSESDTPRKLRPA